MIGRLAERPIASVLKTEGPKGSVGSNPTSSSKILKDVWPNQPILRPAG